MESFSWRTVGHPKRVGRSNTGCGTVGVRPGTAEGELQELILGHEETIVPRARDRGDTGIPIKKNIDSYQIEIIAIRKT